MAACDCCGSSILFGGTAVGSLRFCSEPCAGNGRAMVKAISAVPQEEIVKQVRAIHEGKCPRCGGPGPVDLHTRHKVASMLFVTRWSSDAVVCCRRCGRLGQFGSLLSSLLLGWWGFPWGLVLTPVQVSRNLLGMAFGPDPRAASPALEKMVSIRLASRLTPGAFSRRPLKAMPLMEGMDHRFG
jgi:hypothetical protein